MLVFWNHYEESCNIIYYGHSFSSGLSHVKREIPCKVRFDSIPGESTILGRNWRKEYRGFRKRFRNYGEKSKVRRIFYLLSAYFMIFSRSQESLFLFFYFACSMDFCILKKW